MGVKVAAGFHLHPPHIVDAGVYPSWKGQYDQRVRHLRYWKTKGLLDKIKVKYLTSRV